jgi:hypothetical protein
VGSRRCIDTTSLDEAGLSKLKELRDQRIIKKNKGGMNLSSLWGGDFEQGIWTEEELKHELRGLPGTQVMVCIVRNGSASEVTVCRRGLSQFGDGGEQYM